MSEIPHKPNEVLEKRRQKSIYHSMDGIENPPKPTPVTTVKNTTDNTLHQLSNKTEIYFGFKTIEPEEPKR